MENTSNMTRADEIATLIVGELIAGNYPGSDIEMIAGILEKEYAAILKREHAAVVRMVKKLRRIDLIAFENRKRIEINKEDGAYVRRDELLAALERRRGKR